MLLIFYGNAIIWSWPIKDKNEWKRHTSTTRYHTIIRFPSYLLNPWSSRALSNTQRSRSPSIYWMVYFYQQFRPQWTRPWPHLPHWPTFSKLPKSGAPTPPKLTGRTVPNCLRGRFWPTGTWPRWSRPCIRSSFHLDRSHTSVAHPCRCQLPTTQRRTVSLRLFESCAAILLLFRYVL